MKLTFIDNFSDSAILFFGNNEDLEIVKNYKRPDEFTKETAEEIVAEEEIEEEKIPGISEEAWAKYEAGLKIMFEDLRQHVIKEYNLPEEITVEEAHDIETRRITVEDLLNKYKKPEETVVAEDPAEPEIAEEETAKEVKHEYEICYCPALAVVYSCKRFNKYTKISETKKTEYISKTAENNQLNYVSKEPAALTNTTKQQPQNLESRGGEIFAREKKTRYPPGESRSNKTPGILRISAAVST